MNTFVSMKNSTLIHLIPAKLSTKLHLPTHGSLAHMLRRYCPPTSKSACVI